MSLTIAVGGLVHETNTYAAPETSLTEFEVRRGVAIERDLAGTSTTVGGILAASEEIGARAIPLVHASAEPSGLISERCYRQLADEISAAVAAAGPLDVIALDLHGAGVADGVEDLEWDLCRRVREVAGWEPLLVATFDLHGNVSAEMVEVLDLTLACREYPHTDFFTRGAEMIRQAARLSELGVRGGSHVERLPLLIGAGPASCTLHAGPARSMKALCEELSARPGIVDCSFFHGFAPADVSCAGASIVVTDEGDGSAGRLVAEEAASRLWAIRDDFEQDLPTPREAIERALASGSNPVVVNDIGDNPGGGAPGDGTRLLAAMLEAEVEDSCLGVIWDPDAVGIATAAGPGETVSLRLGGKASDLGGDPLQVSAYVKSIGDGRFQLQSMWRGVEMDMGGTVRLQIDGVDVLVSSKRRQVFDPEVFLVNGIDVRRSRIVGVKSAVHFRAGFEPIGAAVVSANSPGLSSAKVGDFRRVRSGRDLYPLNRATRYGARSG